MQIHAAVNAPIRDGTIVHRVTRKESLACAPDEILQSFIDDAGSQLQLRLGAVVVARADVYGNPDASLVPICRDGKHGSGHNVGSASGERGHGVVRILGRDQLDVHLLHLQVAAVVVRVMMRVDH